MRYDYDRNPTCQHRMPDAELAAAMGNAMPANVDLVLPYGRVAIDRQSKVDRARARIADNFYDREDVLDVAVTRLQDEQFVESADTATRALSTSETP